MALAKPKRKPRGASSKQLKPSTSYGFNLSNVNIVWSKFVPLAICLVLLLVSAGLYQAVAQLLSLQVTRVAVNGEFRHIDKQLIAAEVQPFLVDGFVLLDLEGIRQQLIKRPWIFDVAISRQWPDEIVIIVMEQTPIALWGERGLVNHHGKVFTPDGGRVELQGLEGLPQLSGPDNSVGQVMKYFRELREALLQHGLGLQQLVLNDRGSWSARLDDGINIVLGGAEVMEKMHRFLSAYQQGLAADFSEVTAVDMRYSNGFAIAWKASHKKG